MFHIEYQVIKCSQACLRPADEYIVVTCHSQHGQQFTCGLAHAALDTISHHRPPQLLGGGEACPDGLGGNRGVLRTRCAEQYDGRLHAFAVYRRNSEEISTRLYK